MILVGEGGFRTWNTVFAVLLQKCKSNHSSLIADIILGHIGEVLQTCQCCCMCEMHFNSTHSFIMQIALNYYVPGTEA